MLKDSIYLITSDQRVEDNPAFFESIKNSRGVIPVYIFDIKQLKNTNYDSLKMGKYRHAFLFESLINLKSNLQSIGADLWYFEGIPIDILLKIRIETGINTIFLEEKIGTEEVQFITECKKKGFEMIEIESANLLSKHKLPFNIHKLPLIFTDFRKQIEKNIIVQTPIPRISHFKLPEKKPAIFNVPVPILIEKDKRSAFPFSGGEDFAKERVKYYFFDSKKIFQYKETRNGLLGKDYSSKLSAWLANGNLSARWVYYELIKVEEHYRKNQSWEKIILGNMNRENFSSDSTYWIVFELLWREFFRLNAFKFGSKIFQKEGILRINKKNRNDLQLLEKWKHGQTGDDFVDANMRELLATGYMSNRGRQNVASFLVHDLELDWRLGAAWFEEMLIDYDPYSNWCNWQYVAGVGNDPRFRKFNTQLQSKIYDPKWEYRAHWLTNG